MKKQWKMFFSLIVMDMVDQELHYLGVVPKMLLIIIFYLFYLLIEIINLDLSLNIWKSRGPEHLYYICVSVCLFVDTLADSVLKKMVFWETEIFCNVLFTSSTTFFYWGDHKMYWRKVIIYIYIIYAYHFRKQKIPDVIKMCMPCLTRVRNMVL